MSKASVLLILALSVLALSAVARLSLAPTRGQEPCSYTADWGSIDVFCQRGGRGHLVPSSPFCPNEQVRLYAKVAYCEWPEQNCDVTFEISGPCSGPFLLSGRTNASGVAAVSFRLPSSEYVDRVFGAWRVIATVNVAEVIVSDALEFCVKWSLADVNSDGEVDVSDAITVSLAYASAVSDPSWNYDCDVAKTYGVIDIFDIVTVAMDYGQGSKS